MIDSDGFHNFEDVVMKSTILDDRDVDESICGYLYAILCAGYTHFLRVHSYWNGNYL